MPLKPETIQKKGSFIKEIIKAPELTATTDKTGFIFKRAREGATTEEAVTTATGKEPVKSLTTAAIRKGTNIARDEPPIEETIEFMRGEFLII